MLSAAHPPPFGDEMQFQEITALSAKITRFCQDIRLPVTAQSPPVPIARHRGAPSCKHDESSLPVFGEGWGGVLSTARSCRDTPHPAPSAPPSPKTGRDRLQSF